MTEPAFTAIVVTYNSAHEIGGLLDSLPAAVDGALVETIVVDNDSTDDTAAIVAARADCTLVRSANSGYAGGINRGYEVARGRGPVLILNPDVRLRPGSVTALAGALQAPGVGITVPRIYGPDGALQFSLRREPTIARALGLTFTGLPVFSEGCNRAADYDAAHAVDWATGAVFLIRRECYDALGEWDASFFMYSEEVDFCLRARDAGWITWYEPAAVVEHIGQASGFNADLYAMQVVNRVRLYRRRNGTAAAWIYWLAAIAAEGSRALLGSRIRRRAVEALIRPSRRPPQLGDTGGLLPE